MIDITLLPPEQRSAALTAAKAQNVATELRQKGRCEACALMLEHCVCGGLDGLTRELAMFELGLRFAVWMHVSERLRASNTGKLLLRVLPGCELFLHGLPADAERFRSRIAGCKAYVLFPSDTAVALSAVAAEILTAAAAAIGSPASAADGEDAAAPPLIVLVDGTWDQAKRMHRALRHLPHVALAAPDGAAASAFSWRQQSEEGRITTAEAAALLLDGVSAGRAGAGGAARIAGADALRRAVALLDRALGSQTHYSKSEPPKAGKGGLSSLVVSDRARRVADAYMPPCKHHLRGSCRFGSACAFRHGEASVHGALEHPRLSQVECVV